MERRRKKAVTMRYGKAEEKKENKRLCTRDTHFLFVTHDDRREQNAMSEY